MLEETRKHRTLDNVSVPYGNTSIAIQEDGTDVYDCYGKLIGKYPTENEAIEIIRENL